VPSLAALECVGEAKDHAVVKRREYEGFIAKSLSIEIVTWIAGCFSHSLGAFLLMYQRTWDSPTVARLALQAGLPWAAPVGCHAPVC